MQVCGLYSRALKESMKRRNVYIRLHRSERANRRARQIVLRTPKSLRRRHLILERQYLWPLPQRFDDQRIRVRFRLFWCGRVR
jgi:hypothetical protein